MSEQINTAAAEWSAVVGSWERGPHNVRLTDSNFEFLKVALANAMRQGVSPSAEAWQKIVADESALGHLELNVVIPKAEDPADHLPHPNEPKLRNLRTIEDFRELSAEQTRVFTQPAAFDTGLNTKFNQRYAYVVQNKIHRTKAEEAPATAIPAKPSKPNRVYMLTPQEAAIVKEHNDYNQSCIDEVNAIISNHMGRTHGRTAGERQILVGVRDTAIKSGKSAKEVLDAVRAKWNSFGRNDSAR